MQGTPAQSDEKQVVFWEREYVDRARAERAEVLQKALSLIEDPGKHTRATSQSAAKCVKNLVFDKETDEVAKVPGKPLSFIAAFGRSRTRLG